MFSSVFAKCTHSVRQIRVQKMLLYVRFVYILEGLINHGCFSIKNRRKQEEIPAYLRSCFPHMLQIRLDWGMIAATSGQLLPTPYSLLPPPPHPKSPPTRPVLSSHYDPDTKADPHRDIPRAPGRLL